MLHEFATRGSIARTADALGYTPSAVSQQLAVLEREAGTPLLDRTARSAGLTDAGRRLAIHAERILAMVEEAEADLSAQAAQPSGRVVVTAFPSAAVAFAPALARSLRAHPRLSLLLRQSSPAEGLQLVRTGEVEVAIVDDWTGRLAANLNGPDATEHGQGVLSYYHLVRDPLCWWWRAGTAPLTRTARWTCARCATSRGSPRRLASRRGGRRTGCSRRSG